MKYLFFPIVLVCVFSCNENSNSHTSSTEPSSGYKDTIIVTQKNELNKFYEVGFLSKSYSYFWVSDKDTSDLKFFVTEYEKDSSVHITISHRRTMLFETALNKLNDCLKLIEKDFSLGKLGSLYFKEPIYYPDLSKSLTEQYIQKFGQKTIDYSTLNQFLLTSDLTKLLNNFLTPLKKMIKRYSIEKFHLLNKESYQLHLPGNDYSQYPDFTLNGMGLYIQLN